MSLKAKIIPLILCGAMAVSMMPVTSLAADSSEDATAPSENDIFAAGYSETIIDGEACVSIDYYYNENGNRVVAITDSKTGITDLVEYDEDAGVIYLNDTVCAYVSVTHSASEDAPQTARGGWVYMGSYSGDVTFVIQCGAFIIATAISALVGPAVGSATAAIIASVGSQTLNYISAHTNRVYVSGNTWRMTSGIYINQKDTFTMTAFGNSYGPYTTIVGV